MLIYDSRHVYRVATHKDTHTFSSLIRLAIWVNFYRYLCLNVLIQKPRIVCTTKSKSALLFLQLYVLHKYKIL